MFVPQFDGDLGAADGPAVLESEGSPAFDTESGAEGDGAAGLDDETSFADVLDPSDAIVAEPPAPPAPPAAAPAPAEAAVVSLTKFRSRAASPEASAAPPPAAGAALPTEAPPAPAAEAAQEQRATALGKLRLVRRQRGGGRKRHPILRLFGSF